MRRVFHVAGAQPAHSSAKTAAARVEVSDRTITTYSFDERAEGLAVSTTSRRGEVTAGEERLHRCGHRRAHDTPDDPAPVLPVGGNEQHDP